MMKKFNDQFWLGNYPSHYIRGLKQFLFVAEVVTVVPESKDGEFIISEKQLRYAIGNKKREAVAIRTLPNTKDKLNRQYAHSNPPYLSQEAAVYLRNKGVKHLLIDLPSVDKEKDDGQTDKRKQQTFNKRFQHWKRQNKNYRYSNSHE